MNSKIENAGLRLKDLSLNIFGLIKDSLIKLFILIFLFLFIHILLISLWIQLDVNPENISIPLKIIITILISIIAVFLITLIFYKFLINSGVNKVYDNLSPEINHMSDYFINEWDKQKDQEKLNKPIQFFENFKAKLPPSAQSLLGFLIKQLPLSEELPEIQNQLKQGNKTKAKEIFQNSLNHFIKQEWFDVKEFNWIYIIFLVQLILQISLIFI